MAKRFPAPIFFDLVGTLIRPRGSLGEQYANRARRFGAAAADPRRMDAAFADAMRQAPVLAFSGRSLEETAAAERAWWHRLVLKVIAGAGLDAVLNGETFERFFADLYHAFATADAWDTYPDSIPALERLHAHGRRVGLITNYDTRVYRVLDALGLAPLLDTVTIPALVGAAKPDAAIFGHALQELQAEARDAVYVGDEVEDDYDGARKAGMIPVLLDRHDAHRGKGLRRIRSLDELGRAGASSSDDFSI